MDDKSQDQPTHAVAMSNRDLISIFILGGVSGLLVWGIGMLLSRFVLDALLCQNGVGGQCAYAPGYAEGAALALVSIAALGGLIRLRVYRPLLIVLAAAISLWGIAQLAWRLEWYWGLLVSIVLYLLAYGVFAWIARTRAFWMALVATVILVVAVRLALSL